MKKNRGKEYSCSIVIEADKTVWEKEEKIMKLKKALSLLLAGTMALSLAACGGSGSGEEGAAKDEAAEGGKTLKVAAVETATAHRCGRKYATHLKPLTKV